MIAHVQFLLPGNGGPITETAFKNLGPNLDSLLNAVSATNGTYKIGIDLHPTPGDIEATPGKLELLQSRRQCDDARVALYLLLLLLKAGGLKGVDLRVQNLNAEESLRWFLETETATPSSQA
jgi:hypothetical protein